MIPIYTDLHIHTSQDPNNLDENYDLDLLVQKIKEFNGNSEFLISITDHNTVNKGVYLKAVGMSINIILGVELHIKNYENCPAYHCHIYFDIPIINEKVIDDINAKLDALYPNKVVEKSDPTIPQLDRIIREFDDYEFMLLPHGGQSHATFDKSIPNDVKFDTTLEKSIYYNQFDGFTARGDGGLEKTQQYFRRLGINEFVNLITCSDNYTPRIYPNGKDQNPFKPTWILAEPTFNGLRLSLSEQSRLVYSEQKPIRWSEKIKSIKHIKPNIEIEVEFTSGLNVVIGGSSSGKTLLVDSICKGIEKNFEETVYVQYEIDKIEIDNPSGMIPHYIGQNYIMSIVNNVSDDNLENIEIIKRVFPGDEEIKEKINSGLRAFRANIQDLVKNVKIIEQETKALGKIPHISRLILKGKTENNIFEGLVPQDQEVRVLNYAEHQHDEYIDALNKIEGFLSNYPFVNHNPDLTKQLIDELEIVINTSIIEKEIRQVIAQEKKEYDNILKELNTEEQSKKQDFQKLLASLGNYLHALKEFHRILKVISDYKIDCATQEIESMGHKLYIQNDFKLDKSSFVKNINYYLKEPISDFSLIDPKMLFESNFKKKSPKVHDYDDFEKKVYSSFEVNNKKKYKIITKDGRDFDSLSPGWKTSVILDIILGYDQDLAPIIIDQPEDNLATNYINDGLVTAIKKIKNKKQIILVSHNATIPMLGDAQNIILCRNENNKLIIKSSPLEGKIDGKSVVDYIAEITDGGKPSIKKRVKKYNLKKLSE